MSELVDYTSSSASAGSSLLTSALIFDTKLSIFSLFLTYQGKAIGISMEHFYTGMYGPIGVRIPGGTKETKSRKHRKQESWHIQ